MSDAPKDASRSLIDAVEQGRAFQRNQSRFRTWLGAFHMARYVVEPLSRSPGMQDIEGHALKAGLEEIVAASAQCTRYLEKKIGEKNDSVDVSHPAHRVQIKRMVLETLASHWPSDQAGLFRHAPSGATFEQYPAQMKLFLGYLDFVADQIEREDDQRPGHRSFAEDYRLDRLLTVHSVYHTIDRVVQPFFERHIADQSVGWQTLILGEQCQSGDYTADTLTREIVTAVILPVVDARQGEIMAVFDPQGEFSAEDRHLAYRALLHNVSADAALIVETEQARLIERCEAIDETPEEAIVFARSGGVFMEWLTDRLTQRLDRVYPRVDEYV